LTAIPQRIHLSAGVKWPGAEAIASLELLWRGCVCAAAVAGATLCCALLPAHAEDAKARAAIRTVTNRVETVVFTDPRWPPVRVIRGTAPAASATPAPAPIAAPIFRATAANTQIVTFGDGRGERVKIVRGAAPEPVRVAAVQHGGRIETVRFGGFGAPLVNIVRGSPPPADAGIELFGAANGGELDRVAFAVDGAESGHGANLAMWRPDPDGPQGPMQVSAAAALDVGGGNRFDMRENRLIGRAFLARMYQRYGNWPDAIAAYNWGPGNLDNWIAAGRPVERLPLETARYLLKVLRDALLTHL
jgi:soluble lytic murein transglycosylase-like protein